MTRIVVVGGGIVGASTAYHLARRGSTVVVVDPSIDGAATDASAGVISPIGARPRPAAGYLFAATSYFRDLVAELRELGYRDHGYRQAGELIVASDPHETALLTPLRERVDELIARHGARGVGRAEQVDAAAARDRCPLLGPVESALWLPEVAQVNGGRLRDCLLSVARDNGATLVRQPGSLWTEGDRVTGVALPGEVIDADQVVLTAGAWSGVLAELAGMRLPVRPQRGQIARASLPEHASPPRLPVVSGYRFHYLLQDLDGQIVFGATQDDDAGFDHAVTVGGIAELVTEVTRAAPGLTRARWRGTKAGFRPTTPDGVPLLGRTRQLSHLVVGTGFGSIGLTIGAHAGAQLAALALGQQVDIPEEFDPDRFANRGRTATRLGAVRTNGSD